MRQWNNLQDHVVRADLWQPDLPQLWPQWSYLRPRMPLLLPQGRVQCEHTPSPGHLVHSHWLKHVHHGSASTDIGHAYCLTSMSGSLHHKFCGWDRLLTPSLYVHVVTVEEIVPVLVSMSRVRHVIKFHYRIHSFTECSEDQCFYISKCFFQCSCYLVQYVCKFMRIVYLFVCVCVHCGWFSSTCHHGLTFDECTIGSGNAMPRKYVVVT